MRIWNLDNLVKLKLHLDAVSDILPSTKPLASLKKLVLVDFDHKYHSHIMSIFKNIDELTFKGRCKISVRNLYTVGLKGKKVK